jgi:hypothetical protein
MLSKVFVVTVGPDPYEERVVSGLTVHRVVVARVAKRVHGVVPAAEV